ncbi:MAG: flavin reductase family protein [Pseudomonadota bacterium]
MTSQALQFPDMTEAVFKAGMRQLVGGVTAVTTMHEGRQAGLTATAVCSVSAEPPRLLVCVNCRGETYEMIGASRIFSVNILAREHEDLAKRFAGMLPLASGDKFEGDGWDSAATGAPMLKNALASFDCRVSMIMDTGSHGVVIGDIQHVRVRDGGSPLLYSSGEFTTTAIGA